MKLRTAATVLGLCIALFGRTRALIACVGCNSEWAGSAGNGSLNCPNTTDVNWTDNWNITSGQFTVVGVGCSPTGYDSTFTNRGCVEAKIGNLVSSEQFYRTTSTATDCIWHNVEILTQIKCTSLNNQIETFKTPIAFGYRCNKDAHGNPC